MEINGAKRACKSCINDQYIYQNLREYGELTECSYCHNIRKTISVELIAKEIEAGISQEYMHFEMEDYNPKTSEYIIDTEILETVLYDKYKCDDILFDDICRYIPIDGWYERDNKYYGDKENIITYSKKWDEFAYMVKYETRYVFFQQWNEDELDTKSKNILGFVADAIEALQLKKYISPNTNFFRGRTHNSIDNKPNNEAALASPPACYAKANRMSAEGISIFYGANNTKTVLAEIYNGKDKYATIAQFKNTNELCLLDLTGFPNSKLPSLFDAKNRGKRDYIRFFNSFIKTIMKPVDQSESIEYVPTQILTEYFRHVYGYGVELDGIIYPSSKNDHGKCYALFFNNERCINGENQALIIEKKSIKTYYVYNKMKYHLVNERGILYK